MSRTRHRYDAMLGFGLLAALAAGCTAVDTAGAGAGGEPAWSIQRNAKRWTIFVTHFTDQQAAEALFDLDRVDASGKGAAAAGATSRTKRAENLVGRLRREHGLEAYWDHGAGAYLAQIWPKEADRYRNTSAVYVGGFDSPREPDARQTLQRVRQVVAKLPSADVVNKRVFFTPNPAVKVDKAKSVSASDYPAGVNNCPNSLIHDCSGKYTLRVLLFHGASTMDRFQTSDADLLKRSMTSRLKQAERSANLIARQLRETGHEAYVLHGRHSSFVCIGSYDDRRDPRVAYDRRRYTGMTLAVRSGRPGQRARKVKLLPPALMVVPK